MINQPGNSAAETNPETDSFGSRKSSLIDLLIWRPVARWYIRPLQAQQLSENLRPSELQSVRRQAVIGWLQTLLLIIVFVQVIFDGLLRVLPPDVRTTLSFLHRIEWGAYLGITLVVAQVAVGWSDRIVVTNRFYLLAWRFSPPKLVMGREARACQVAYIGLAVVMVAAVVWVRIHGFIVTPTT